MVIGIVGPVVGFFVTGSYRWPSAVIWISIGLLVLIPTLVVRRRVRGRSVP